MTAKAVLRARLRAIRAAEGKAALAVPNAFRAALRPGIVVASYVPVGSEADPAPFVAAARAVGCGVALPHVTDHATPLRFLAWSPEAPLVRGPFGLSQPRGDAPELVPDIILTPLVGFDAAGNRLGQGAGHYDRAFARHPQAWRIGIAYARQQVDALAADPWDVPLHAIATEKDWIVP